MEYFYNAFDAHFGTYFSFVLLCLFFYFSIIKPFSASYLDPMLVSQFFSAFATANVVFMYWAGIISPTDLARHFLAMSIFYLVFISLGLWRNTFQAQRRVKPIYSINKGQLLYLKMSLFLLISVQVVTWFFIGIPALMESRLDAFSSGGGTGLLNRFIPFLTLYVTAMAVYLRNYARGRWSVFAVIFMSLAGILNGGKSFVLMLIGIAVVSDYFFNKAVIGYKPLRIDKKIIAYFAAFAVVGALAAQYIELREEASIERVFLQLGYRFILSGDGYLWFYGDGLINKINHANPFLLSFSDVIGSFRIAPWSELPVHPGLQMYQYFFPESDKIAGPNARIDIVASMSPVFVAIIYYIFIGVCVWLFRNALLFCPKGGVQRIIVIIALAVHAPSLVIDPVYGVSLINNLLFGLPILLGMKAVNVAVNKNA